MCKSKLETKLCHSSSKVQISGSKFEDLQCGDFRDLKRNMKKTLALTEDVNLK